jgi:hypothetical protein
MLLLHAALYELPGGAQRQVRRNGSGKRFPPIVTQVDSVHMIKNEVMDGYAQLDIENVINSRETQFI